MTDANTPLSKRLSSTNAPSLINLFAANDTAAGDPLAVVPVEQFEGVPEYYLVHVVNPNNYGIIGSSAVTNSRFVHGVGTYSASFTLSLDRTDPVTGLSSTSTQAFSLDGTTGTRISTVLSVILTVRSLPPRGHPLLAKSILQRQAFKIRVSEFG